MILLNMDISIRHKQFGGVIAAFAAFCIFGVSSVLTKDLTNSGLFSPLVLVAFRLVGACGLFWLVSPILGSERVDAKDILLLIPASLIHMVIAKIATIQAIVYATPFDTSMIATLKPLFTLSLAAIILKLRVSIWHIIGILLGMLGVYLLVSSSGKYLPQDMGTRPIGAMYALLNCLCSSIYIVLFRPLILKYKPITITKWIFLIAVLILVPFTIPDIISIDYASFTLKIWMELGFVVVFATFMTYFLTSIGHKYLPPVTYSVFTYFQPLVAAILGVIVGMDVFSWEKGAAVILMIAAVIMVNIKNIKNA